VSIAAVLLLFCGCNSVGSLGAFTAPAGPVVTPVVQNPLLVPVPEREFVWNQLVDALDDYFQIAREERVRDAGGVLLEGRIDTRPSIGSTVLEPWRNDATPGFEKLHGTLQSIRRTAQMRVIPSEGGYLVELAVYKELEDVLQPEFSTVGGVTLRHDNSLDRTEEAYGQEVKQLSPGWIPLGRDVALEQQILADIQARLINVTPPSAPRWPF
jgi:hypothetical protein